MSNFSFIPEDFQQIADSAVRAEGHIMGDPRAACFHARFTLEALVHWLYRHDPSLNMPYDQNLAALLHEPSFQNRVPQTIFTKARLIHKVGNQAVHSPSPIRKYDAMQTVKELFHLCYWLVRTYSPQSVAEQAPQWQEARIPRRASAGDVVPRKELEALEQELSERNAQALKEQQDRDALDAELQALREELEQIRAATEQNPDPHDYNEAETRDYLIDKDLNRAGWPLDQPQDREYEVKEMPNPQGIGYVDYVLWGDDGKPLAVVEAKRTSANPEKGQQQAKLYADCLEKATDQRPLIFYTNGYATWFWDDLMYPPRQVAGFYKKEELALIVTRRQQRKPLSTTALNPDIAGRYYQTRAIGNIFTQFAQARRKALLVMATGTGKTRTAISLVDALQRLGWAKRVLFLADRISLVNQACNAFKQHLPESSPVNLVTEKDKHGRVYLSTYPTVMGMIDELDGSQSRFGVGHFDLVICDEIHRSVYRKYGAILDYFDGLLLGLTATPREEVDKNTYTLFDLEDGVPTDAYELEQAVRDEFLVPPRVQQVDLKFPREGINYDELSDEDKAEWDMLEWEGGLPPKKVESGALNNWLFNSDTVDKVLQYLMEHGHKVADGDRLAKTIIFARNHEHAVFIEQRFNHHYPEYAGHFARVIDNQAKYPHTLIEDFSMPDHAPHIAISVDMMDTGIDVPEVANLVFFKPVYSKIKFWQMIGRGTRLCPGLFGPGDDKQDFRVFDFCFNFDFFKIKPEGIQNNETAPLGTRIFRQRAELLMGLQADVDSDPDETLRTKLGDWLHGEVQAMNRENFLVRMRMEAVERFAERSRWIKLSPEDVEKDIHSLSQLPTATPVDDVESRRFDLLCLRMQLSWLHQEIPTFESLRNKVQELSRLLEEKTAIPAVKQQLSFLQAIQEPEYWEGISVQELEDLRLRLRGLVPLLEKQKRVIVYTNFEDEIKGVRDEEGVPMPKMTSTQFEKKVRKYLEEHRDNLVIHRLRTNHPLTETDLEGLEHTLEAIGEEEGPILLEELLERSGAPSLPHFIRSLVGMDKEAVQKAFADYLSDSTLSPSQIRFLHLIVEQLTARGVMSSAALYEPPFSDLHAGGPDALFADNGELIEGVFKTLKKLEPEVGRDAV